MSKKLERIKTVERAAIETALAATIKKLNNDANHFVNNLLTDNERMMIGRRVLIAHLILSGYTQMEINQHLSTSPNTYTKIKRWLEESLPNFESTVAIERKRVTVKNLSKTTRTNPLSFESLRKKYPMHFLLFNISKEIIDRLKP